MAKRKIAAGVLAFLSVCAVVACGGSHSEPKQSTATAPDLPHVNITLPDAPGRQAYATNCLICHSAAYVKNQPDFPEKTWTAIVKKMQKNYGAPVSDSAANEIIQYLVAIKGKP